MSDNVVELMTTKSDHDLASELRSDIIAATKHLTDVMDKATSQGFNIAINLGQDGFRRSVVTSLVISKVFNP